MQTLPTDDNKIQLQGTGSTLTTFWISTTGGWDAVELPPGIECKSVKINVHDGVDGYAHSGSQEFMYSSLSDGSVWDWALDGLVINVAKASGTICYVKAPSGNKITVTALA